MPKIEHDFYTICTKQLKIKGFESPYMKETGIYMKRA